jgi:eukaryotic-like serine/threonine-protein kinase
MNKELSENSILSHYRIISKIGAGGMGEVYLAQDTKLDRKVAIKFLHEEFSKDADKLNRFIQEAKAASALNHPNILTVYEIGEVDGKNYIATELIDGKTLREHLSHKESLQLNAILKIGVQVSEALSAAHQAGIIHRDIKPENIMLRKDGYAKVLDFGLAKLSEPRAVATGSAGSEDATRVQVNTTPGVVMGTVSYMSPEQARGNVTDARTDIWSLGVVLYEMLAGKVPFTGETINHTIVSILEREPLLLENVPGELQRIVRKSMTKDVDMRYQTAHDLLIDLKNLRRDLDIQGELERSIIPNRTATTESADENQTQVYAGVLATAKSGSAATAQNVTTSSSSLEYAVSQAKRHKLVTTLVALALLGVISTVGYFAFVAKGKTGINSIAVLPFENRSGNPDSDYLSDGLAESLIYRLSQLPNLKVSSTSSVLRYKGKEIDAQRIASELGVQSVMTGRMTQRGENLSISVELIDAGNNKTIWGEQYERKMSDLLATQREIATTIAEKLQLKLSGEGAKGITKRYTESNEAYQLYLKGRFLWNKWTSESLKLSVEFYNQAIGKDPTFALAYSGLAEAYVLFPNYDVATAKASMPQAKAAAMRALELDDSLAEAHTALGWYLGSFEYDWAGSEREFRRAIELNPKYATAHQWLAQLLAETKRFDEGQTETKLALESDPLSPVISFNIGWQLFLARRYDDALREFEHTASVYPDFPLVTSGFCWSYYAKGDLDHAIPACRKTHDLIPDAYNTGYLSLVLGRAGQREEARKLLAELKNQSSRREIPSMAFAFAYMGLDQKEEAMAMLEKEVEDRGYWSSSFATQPELDEFRSDPRFKALLKRMNLPE